MRRRGHAERGGGRCGRIKVERVMGVVMRGKSMGMGRSGRQVVKRTMTVRGGDGEGTGVVDMIVRYSEAP